MVYDYLGVPEFEHDFDNVPQVTQEDDRVYGAPGLHDIRSKVEPLTKDYMTVLGRDAVLAVQNNFAWYFTLFGYPIAPV